MIAHDVAIVGGAVVGSATAYYLGQLAPDLSVAVYERDPSYEFSSTMRCEGNLRVQFDLEENIQMSRFTNSLLASFADEMQVDGWRPDLQPGRQGNLFLVPESGRGAALAAIDFQRSLGCDVTWLDPDEIAARWPVYSAPGVAGGSFGPQDGPIDPSALLHAYRRNASRLGATYVTSEVAKINAAGGAVQGLQLSDGEVVAAPVVVNCAGGWAPALAATAGVAIPVEPVMRTVYIVDTPFDTAGLPLVFLPGGVYLVPEGPSSFEAAWSRPDDPVGFDFTFSRAGFESRVWPELVAALPAFDSLVVTGGWRGLYDMNTLDANAIIGEWPSLEGYFMANGLSGHGFQHAPAMGHYLAELIAGVPPTLDLSRLGPERVVAGEPLLENASRII